MPKLYTIIFSIILSSSPLLLKAGEAELQAATELLNVMQFEKVMNDTTNSSIEMMKQMNPEMVNHEATLRSFFKKFLDIDTLKKETVAIYAETFAVNELKDMIAFYKTSTGQKTLQKLPEIMQRSMQLAQARVMENMGELEAMLAKDVPVTTTQPASV